jgi:hypothetical protein
MPKVNPSPPQSLRLSPRKCLDGINILTKLTWGAPHRIAARMAEGIPNCGEIYSLSTNPSTVFTLNLGLRLEVCLVWSKDKAMGGGKSFLIPLSMSRPSHILCVRYKVRLCCDIMDTLDGLAMLGLLTGIRLDALYITTSAARICRDNS